MMHFQPCVAVLSGPPLHGKSTVARRISSLTNMQWTDVDLLRRGRFPIQSGVLLPVEEERALMTTVYRLSLEMVLHSLGQGMPAVLSGTCSRAAFKAVVAEFVRNERSHTPITVFRLDINSPSIIEQRIASRALGDTPSNIKTKAQYDWALTIVDPWPEYIVPVPIDASRDVDAVAADIISRMSAHAVPVQSN